MTDPLPSWNAGKAKQSILEFVRRVTTEGGDAFVPVPERIAAIRSDAATQLSATAWRTGCCGRTNQPSNWSTKPPAQPSKTHFTVCSPACQSPGCASAKR